MGFSAEWLTLREPADQAARDPDLLSRAAQCATAGKIILDLGSGTGSTARAFAAQGFGGLQWRFLDNDPALLGVAGTVHPDAELVTGDLGDVGALPLTNVSLVTASALLDLMPRSWVEALAKRLGSAGIPFYAALSYDGAMQWTPAHAQDAAVTACFNAHQRGDKGIGCALGPDAGASAADIFQQHSFAVTLRSSPWSLGPDQAALHVQLLDGIGAAAAEAGHQPAPNWTSARRKTAAQSQSVIGHTDLLAIPLAYGS